VGPYQVKEIISTNAIELDLPSIVKIHPVVNISRVHRYKDQVEGQNVTAVPWTSSHILYGLPLYQKSDISKATC